MIKAFKCFIVLFILLLPFSTKAQYSPDEKDLVKTTFDRTFERDIISEYLGSNDPLRVNAGLLSVAQSGDKSFINTITNLDFNKNAEYICFALGQLGPDTLSSAYLYQKLSDPNLPLKFKPYILEAIGKTGFQGTLESLVTDYFSNDYLMFNGISIALFDFYSRGIKDNLNFVKILQNELTAKDIPIQRKAQAAFAVYRTNLSDNFTDLIVNDLNNIFEGSTSGADDNTLVQYYLECLRKSKYFPDNSTFFRDLTNSPNPLIRIESAKALIYFNYHDSDDLSDYLTLLDDENPNVSRQAAISINGINIPGTLKSELKSEIYKRLNQEEEPSNTKGELLISYIKLFPESFPKLLESFQNKIGNEYLFKAASFFPDSISTLDYLITNYKSGSSKDKIEILGYLIGFQNSFGSNHDLKEILFNALKSDSPALVSIAADGIDSTLIGNNEVRLSRIISGQTIKFLNNADFIESLFSLNGLADKLDKNTFSQNLQDLSNSNIFKIRAFAKNKLGLPVEQNQTNDTLFINIWKDSFKYKFAEIVTEKGTFRIKLLPEYAPITVGNFCYLTENKFFNNLIFHRVVPGFVIQGGDPTGTGWGGPGYPIVSEFSQLHYFPGTVGMASSGKDTEGSQWFVTIGDFPHLDRRYTIFGFVVDGMNVVNSVDQNDKIITIRLTH
jgi:cyclophilin family peptidyl-prolyl cis-trans isomerase